MNGYEILSGAVDLHMHPGPAQGKRRVDFIEAARDARTVGMKAIVYKPVEFPTIDRAYAAEKALPGIRIFGGIVLDYPMGGLNPEAVKVAVRRGAKIIWMPLLDSLHTRKMSEKVAFYKGKQKQKEGLTIFDEAGKLLPEVAEILDTIADAGSVVLDTSHLAPQESLVIIDEAKKRGINNIVVSHPAADIIGATEEQQRQMAEKGAYLNYCYSTVFSTGGLEEGAERIAHAIKTIGAGRCCLSSDCGNILLPLPIEGLRLFTTVLTVLGIDDQEIDQMIRRNPTRILGL